MIITFARVLSFAFNPVFLLAFVPFFLIYRTTYDIIASLWWTLYSLIFLLGIGIFMIYSVRKGTFTDLDVSKREQRPILYRAGLIALAAYLLGLFLLQAPVILLFTSIGLVVALFVFSVVNRQIKASLHVGTITAIIVAFVLSYRGWYVLFLLFIPLIAWARLKVKRHTLPETIVGGSLGAALALSLYILVKLLLR